MASSSSSYPYPVTSWDSLNRQAKRLESRLDIIIQSYTSVSQSISSDRNDEESGICETDKERDLSIEIDHSLKEFQDCISKMKSSTSSEHSSSSGQREGLVKRYTEICYDYNNEFKNASNVINRKRESMQLFHSRRNKKDDSLDRDGPFANLLRERSSISNSMRGINDLLSNAMDAKTSLLGQRQSLTGASSGLRGLLANVPSFNKLIDGIRRKKYRDHLILSVVIGILCCFCLYYVLF